MLPLQIFMSAFHKTHQQEHFSILSIQRTIVCFFRKAVFWRGVLWHLAGEGVILTLGKEIDLPSMGEKTDLSSGARGNGLFLSCAEG